MARVCSWCGFPDTDWLKSLEPLGTALKPSWEPIVIARKPLAGTVAANVLQHGTGGMNIDGCRVGFASDADKASAFPGGKLTTYGAGTLAGPGAAHDADRTEFTTQQNAAGRWPPNTVFIHHPECVQTGVTKVKTGMVVLKNTVPGTPSDSYSGGLKRLPHGEYGYANPDGTEEVPAWQCADGCPVKALDGQSGTLTSGKPSGVRHAQSSFGHIQPGYELTDYGDTGGVSRFFPQFTYDEDEKAGFFFSAKTARKERDAGLSAKGNLHPTVKPLSLMRWLCRLITPPGGIVLDLFMGSGSTGAAAVLEGFSFTGIERDPEYHGIASARIAHHILKARGGVVDNIKAPVAVVATVTPAKTEVLPPSIFDLFGE